jgi:hypothetical protein
MATNGALTRFISNNASSLNSQDHSYFLDYANFTGSSSISPTFNAVTATGGFTGALTGGVTGNVTGNLTGNVTGNLTGNVTGNVDGDVTGTLTGNVSSNGQSNFNNVSINGSLTIGNTLNGNVTGNLTGNVTGRADVATTADKLTTARTIAGVSFDGDSNITLASSNLSDSSEIVKTTATQTLTNKTIYDSTGSFQLAKAGSVIEQMAGPADGRTLTTQSGSYTLQNVTAVMNTTTTHTQITGSLISSYVPPTGTKTVIYRFGVYMKDTDVDIIMHFKPRLDGTDINHHRWTYRGSTGSSDLQEWFTCPDVIIQIDNSLGSDDIANGKVASWTSGKNLEWMAREYSSSYEGRFHFTNHWDGSGTDILVRPTVEVIALA